MSQIRTGQWRLERLEVLNWGTFDGHHTVDIARRGFCSQGIRAQASPRLSMPSPLS